MLHVCMLPVFIPAGGQLETLQICLRLKHITPDKVLFVVAALASRSETGITLG